ncbi:MAG: cyclodeaminase/cyclohydrolase family protein [Anaerolineales bacterium]|nr:cyclodeaminase/cyclohydrolase family protein [Anaerolineales bacterium]
MEENIAAFLKVLDPEDNTTGGGTASAVAGAMAAALAAMVARISIGKEGMEPDDFYEGPIARLTELSEGLFDGAREDSQAFEAVMGAFRMPKETDQEKAARSQAIQKAWVGATRLPLRNSARCIETLEIARELEGRSNKNAASDLTVGIYLARAGALGSLENVRINLPMIKDESLSEELAAEEQELRRRLERLV